MYYLILLSILAISCTTPQPNTAQSSVSASEVVKPSLNFKVDTTLFNGVAVINTKKVSYQISAGMPDGFLKMIVSTCHQEFEVTNVEVKPKADWIFNYFPADKLENVGSCFMRMSVLTDKGVVITGMIDWRDNETLQAKVNCNGKMQMSSGVAFCTAREQLIQKISFYEPVKVASGGNCGDMQATGDNSYEWQVAKGLCVYAIKSESGKFGRLTVLGYSQLKDK